MSNINVSEISRKHLKEIEYPQIFLRCLLDNYAVREIIIIFVNFVPGYKRRFFRILASFHIHMSYICKVTLKIPTIFISLISKM